MSLQISTGDFGKRRSRAESLAETMEGSETKQKLRRATRMFRLDFIVLPWTPYRRPTLAFSCGARRAFELKKRSYLRKILPRRQLQGFVGLRLSKSFVLSGYRPQFFYGGEDHVAIQEFLGKERVYPGESVTVHVYLLHPELLYRSMHQGDSFSLREGLRVVAKGRITRILNLVENAELIALHKRSNPTPGITRPHTQDTWEAR